MGVVHAHTRSIRMIILRYFCGMSPTVNIAKVKNMMSAKISHPMVVACGSEVKVR